MDCTKSMKAKTIAELLPGLRPGILSKDAMQTIQTTAKKQPRPTMAQTRTTEKVLKPLTIAEMRAEIQALKMQSPHKFAQNLPSNKKKTWNSSVKIDKRVSHTANGNLKNNPVRKVLNFQPKVKVPVNSRVTINPPNPETPKFPKPELRAKKSLLQARNVVRISGVCNIPETPNVVKNPKQNRMTIANKENISNHANLGRKSFVPPKIIKHQLIIPSVPDTPLSNESWKSSCDASFLQNEKEIHDIEEKVKAITEEQTLENIAEVTPPVSTPFKEYRNVQEYFNNSSELESSALYNDNTIMCFDKPLSDKGTNGRDESVIVSLCDLLNKVKVRNSEKSNTELEDLLEVEKQTEQAIKMIDNGFQILRDIKKSQLKSLQYVRKLIADKKNAQQLGNEHDETLVSKGNVTPKVVKEERKSPEKSPILGKPCSVIKSPLKSPSYKIPKKNLCLRKKVFHKSMPNIQTPNKDNESRALNMYMKMKEQMNFLNTPLVKHTNIGLPDTPAVTSHNLQRQLDKLYGEIGLLPLCCTLHKRYSIALNKLVKMALSKPIMSLLTSYLQNLYLYPVRTKSLTSCALGTTASIASQLMAGDSFRLDPVLAFGFYGLLFGGSIPHYFYDFLERLFPEEVVAFPLAKKLIFERLVFAPFMQAFSLYTLARFEGKNHAAATKQLSALFVPVLKANWQWLTLFQIINLAFVPPMLRVLFMNFVGLGWAIFLANKRRQNQKKQ
ncbi:hypothetical protein evm_012116 [Chilo suppressalis]|nr:hypothetical protein evm_012116 [Chilo suppressalis]